MSHGALNLQRVLLLRGIAVIGQGMTIAVATIILGWHIPIWHLAAVGFLVISSG